MELQMYRVKY